MSDHSLIIRKDKTWKVMLKRWYNKLEYSCKLWPKGSNILYVKQGRTFKIIHSNI